MLNSPCFSTGIPYKYIAGVARDGRFTGHMINGKHSRSFYG